MPINEIEKSFIQFSFRLNKHYPGLIDTYFGPKEIPGLIKSESKIQLKTLLNNARELLGKIKDADIELKRRTFIYEQMQSLKFFLEHEVSGKYSHKELISKIYQFDFEYVDDTVLSDRINDLEKEVKNREKLYGKEFFDYFKSKIIDFKIKSTKLFKTPVRDLVEVVEGEVQMMAYMEYLGNFKTRITLNSNFERTKEFIENLVAHETYPGHHLNYSLQEKSHPNDPLFGLFLYHTPNDAIVEGIGVFGPELLGYAETELDILKWQSRINANLLYYDKREKRDTVKDYLIQVGRYPPNEAENYLKFMEARFFDIYYPCYWAGYQVIKESYKKCKGLGKEREFLNYLYTEYLTPNLLRRAVDEII